MALKPCLSADGKSLPSASIETNFLDLHEPLGVQQAMAEANRCIYCYDAPCIQACPTAIDIPTFIHQIRTDNVMGSAKTILAENIMGGTCARVCPTEVLCQEACVLNNKHDHAVEIGHLQRFAVDHLMAEKKAHPFKRNTMTGKSIAVVGAGPAGLSCAHRAAMLGHQVTVFEAKEKPGGLNEYGLAAYKMVDDFAQGEVEFLLGIGGIEIKYNQLIGKNISIEQLRKEFDAVFIATGLTDTYSLGLENEGLDGIDDAVDFIQQIRQAKDKSQVKVGNDVVVIGAGNTAIDAAVQAKRLGAANVTLVYRRGEEHMSATEWEINLARTNGVNIHLWAAPNSIKGQGHVKAIEFNKTKIKHNKLVNSGQSYQLKTDMLLKAIGQKLQASTLADLHIERGKIVVNQHYETSVSGVYAGGDAIQSGEDLTVQAVEDGKRAAHAIDEVLSMKEVNHG
ncbi:NAD-dependent dihydropyrimidine dehydrogenase subunit PreT [hydrothermal vent metagenome]|uniref:Dihydrothymine dehydrogenase n=1 Tax=hydrothermal vent metagenome TaxID=652676 RepID=A0A3B0VYJ2_9ZZZZ